MTGPLTFNTAPQKANPRYRYILEDTLTRVKLASIPMYGVTMKKYLATWGQSNNLGEFTGTFRADTKGFDVQELLDATTPGRTNLWVERDGTLIWGGITTTRTYQSESFTYQMYANSFDSFMTGQFLTTDQASFADDPRNLIINLWNYVQGLANCNLGLVTPALVTNQAPLLTYSWTGTDNNPISDEIDAAVKAGAEYRIDTAYANGIRTATLRVGRWDQPVPGFTLGTPQGALDVAFKYPGPISNYWYSESGPQSLTQALGIGSANGASTPRGNVSNALALAAGWPNFGIKFNWSNVTDQTTLINMLNQALIQFAPPFVTATLKLDASISAFGQFELGDYVRCVIVDPYRFPKAPLVNDYRVVGWALTPPTDTTAESFNFTVGQPSQNG